MSSAKASRCIFCHGVLPTNESVEHFRVGKRVAFDPARGRLWAVCPSCRRWNLAPFEERWEALEELEKAARDTGRVLASTENVALIDAPGVELVRVGDARLAEEAWWRYGSQMLRRRTRAQLMTWAERAAMVGVSIATGSFFYLFSNGDFVNNVRRWQKFGSVAWRGEERCTRCGFKLTELRFNATGRLHLTRDVDQDPALHMRCGSCQYQGGVGEYQFEGVVARHILRRVITRHHFKGASEKQVRSATDYIDRLGAPDAVTRELSKTGLRLDALLAKDRRSQALALEIALNEENERRLLEMELAELEARWRQEEEIAAIADGLLTPRPR
ncbi:MAG: hypothetical protein ACN0LA_08505 [Candidatus Longimicrobiales bacterium M2_2A_002]